MNICIIGPGQMGHQHYEAYKQIPDANVVCCVHPQLKTIDNLPSCHCIELAVRDYDIDVIDICAPTEWHYILAAKSLMAGKHTIVEKPLTIRPFQVDALYFIAAENHVQLLPCSPMMFTNSYLKMKNFESPTYGTFSRRGRTPNDTSHIIMDQHYHLLSCLIELYGRPIDYSIKLDSKDSYIFNYQFPTLKIDACIQNSIHCNTFTETGSLHNHNNYISIFDKPEYVNSTLTQLIYLLDCAQKNQQPKHISARTIYDTIDIIEQLEESKKCL